MMTMLAEPTILMPMTKDQAEALTRSIRGHLSDARREILEMHRSAGYKQMGYDSFKDWAIGEFEISWQQVYNLKTAAEVDETILPLVSPAGEPYNIPVNHAKQLRKLKTPEAQARAYQMSLKQAKEQGEEKPTASIIKNTVSTMQAEEYVDTVPYPVVKQMVADGGMTAHEGKQIAQELNKLQDDPAQVYVQKLMARYGLKNPELVYPLGHKHKTERQKGKTSLVLDEIENTVGRLAGTPLAKASLKDLKRANEEAQQQHIADAEEAKRKKQEAKYQQELDLHEQDPDNNPPPKPLPKQVVLTVWQHDPLKTLNNLESALLPSDLDDLLLSLASRRGWVLTDALLTGDPDKPQPETGHLLDVYPFQRNGLECQQADTIQMLIRPQPTSENEEGIMH